MAAADRSDPDDRRRQRLDEVIGEFLVAVDSGQNPDPREWLARHPELQPELAEFFADRERLDNLVHAPRPARPDHLVASIGSTAGDQSTTMASSSVPAGAGTEPTKALTPVRDDVESEAMPPGARIRYFGDYEMLKVLGEGGMGIVYKAHQLSLNRPVALKMIKSARFASADDVRRFQNEAEAVARLDHPNIVPIFEVGQYEDQHYFSMKLVHGQGLDKRLRDFIADTRRAAELIALTARAIHHAHRRGILHRDLKPANVLVDAEGQPHVTDFGLAKRMEGDSELTQSGAILGTPAYMAPEQASGTRGGVTTSTDVYGLGAILYALLTARAPFGGTTVLDTLEQVRERFPEAPRKLNSRVSRDLEVICLKCLEKEPNRRYASAEALAEDLRHWLAGEPILARPVGNAARLWMWCRRRPMIAALTGALTLAILGGLIGTGLGWASASHARKVALNLARDALDAKNDAERQRDVARSTAYTAHMNLAQREWEDNHVQRVIDLLQAEWPKGAEADPRGFEWFYWNRVCHSDLMTLTGHTGGVRRVAFSPDGSRIASASLDCTVKIWDAATGHEILTLKRHTNHVTGVAFSPDGRRIASASDDGTVKVWDAATGKENLTFEGHTNFVLGVAFSPDGRRIASASRDITVKIWDAATGQETLTLKGHAGPVASVAFSPDGHRIASASYDKTVKIWDVATGQETLTLRAHTDTVLEVAFSPDGRFTASASSDKTVKVWDATTGEQKLTLKGHTEWVSGVAFSPDGRRIASAGSDHTVKIWDAATGQETLTLKGHTSTVQSVAFSPDGRRIASASYDTTVKVWDAATGQETLTLKGHTSEVSNVAFNPDGRRIASASSDAMVRIWDAATGQETLALKGHTDFVTGVGFSPDGRRIASASRDKTVKVWDAGTGQETLTLKGHTGFVMGVAFSPDGQRIASASWDKTVKIWDAATGLETLTLKGHTWYVSGVSFSPDGRRIASAGVDHTAKIWDAATGQETLTLKGHASGITSVVFSPDGRRIASASYDGTVRIWNSATGQETVTFKGHTGPVAGVAFSPDGRRVASASWDKTVKISDAATGQETLTLKGHTEFVLGVAFSSDGRHIASASRDGTVKVWDASDK